MTTFGERLKEERVKAGLSQGELAELVGCSNQAISNWELGLNIPKNAKYREALCDVLELTETYLFSGIGEASKAVAEQKQEEARKQKIESERIVYSAKDRVNLESVNLLIKHIVNLPIDTEEKRKVHGTLSQFRTELESKVLFGERR